MPRSCLTRRRKARLEAADSAGAALPSERDSEIRRLHKELAYAGEQNEIPRKTIGTMAERPQWGEQMSELCKERSVSAVAQAPGLSRSGHYARAKAESSARQAQDNWLKAAILRVHRDCLGVYGYPRVRLELRRMGIRLSRRRAARLMGEPGIRSKFKPSGTDSRHGFGCAPNLLGELDSVESAHQVWVSDTTYIRTEQGWAYLAVTVDLGTRFIAGWSVSARKGSELAAAAGKALPCLDLRKLGVPAGDSGTGAQHEPQGQLLSHGAEPTRRGAAKRRGGSGGPRLA